MSVRYIEIPYTVGAVPRAAELRVVRTAPVRVPCVCLLSLTFPLTHTIYFVMLSKDMTVQSMHRTRARSTQPARVRSRVDVRP